MSRVTLNSDDYSGEIHFGLVGEAWAAYWQTKRLHIQAHYDIASDGFKWFACDGRVWSVKISLKRSADYKNCALLSSLPNGAIPLADWCTWNEPPAALPNARAKTLLDRLLPMRPSGAVLTLDEQDIETIASFYIRVGDDQKCVDIRLRHEFLPLRDCELYQSHIKPALIVLMGDDFVDNFSQ